MATVRISQLTAITTPTDDDVFIINDADTNTRKISFANLTQGLLNDSATPQTKLGSLTIGGTLTASTNFVVDTNTFFVDATNNRVGVRTVAPNTELDVDGTVHVRNANPVRFGDANNSNYVALKSPGVVAANFTLTLPDALPAVTNLLVSNSAGFLGYSTGISYDSGSQSLDLGAIKLTNQGSVRFYELAANGSEYIQLNAPASLTTTNAYTLPTAFPAASGFVLSANTSGILSWVSNSASAAGSAAEVQFNDGTGLLSASANFTFLTSTNTLTVTNAVVTGTLTANGDADLGDAITDTISFVGRADTNLIPIADVTHDLGTNLLRWAEVHADDSFVYGDLSVDGDVELGDTVTDLISINGVVDTDILPTGSVDLGSTTAQWSNIFVSGAYIENNVSSSFSRALTAVATATSFDVTIGSATVPNSAKLLIQVIDTTTGDIEFYEHFVTQDGSGGISEISGANTQAPTPGTFLSTPTTAVVGADIVCSITNTAITTNDVDIKVQVVATA